MGFIYAAIVLLFVALFILALEWNRITVGTKSLLFGVHAFWWHPITVWIAWVRLYKEWPTWRECCCIVFHDWGYWGCETMDGPGGDDHPVFGAELASFLFGSEYHDFVLYHSRHLSARHEKIPSLLCWPDKYSMMWDPMWFYLIRASISGEIEEYHANAVKRGFIMPWTTKREWLHKLRNHLAEMSKEQISRLPPKALNS